MNPTPASWMTEDLAIFRESVRRTCTRDFLPGLDRWIDQGHVDRETWKKAGEASLLCLSIPEEWGGLGGTFAHDAILTEELEHCGIGNAFGLTLHNIVIAHYILRYGTAQQKNDWLPRMASGDLITGIAMTEPGGGSDLRAMRTRAVRTNGGYRITGQKTFISHGQIGDLFLVACKTGNGSEAGAISLIAVPADTPGFRRGRKLDKLGQSIADTSELFFDEVEVPFEFLLGEQEGQGLYQMMNQLPRERLYLGISALAASQRAIALTLDYVKERRAFGKRIFDFQNTQFRLAERATEIRVMRSFINDCIQLELQGKLDTATASMAKWWCTDKQCEIIDECLQFFGGYGYMKEYPIARMYADARVQKIYGGTNEIMKHLIAQSL
jgi:acyl-CoA dehydrogenase